MNNPKFIQIAAAPVEDDAADLYALDDEGQVWWLDNGEWRAVVRERDTSQNQKPNAYCDLAGKEQP